MGKAFDATATVLILDSPSLEVRWRAVVVGAAPGGSVSFNGHDASTLGRVDMRGWMAALARTP
jgi:hypothetical protein